MQPTPNRPGRPRSPRPSRLAAAGMLAAAALMILPGCGSGGPEMASVSGTVTSQGKPLPKGTVTFIPTFPEGRNATGSIDAEGNYSLQTEVPGDGAIVGEYKVTVAAQDNPILDYIPKKPVPPKYLAPPKYSNPDTSGLTAKVESGSNTIDLPVD